VKAVNVTVRRSIAAAVVVIAAPALSACGVNFGAQTDQVYNPSAGTDDRSGEVDVLNALIVTGSPGTGTVVAGLVNNDPQNSDQLVNVAGAGQDVKATVTVTGPVVIPAGGLLNLAQGGGVTIAGARIQPGNFVTLTFTFERAEAVTLDVPVMPHSGDYADVPVHTAN
jgi:copper(I)-binding protein